MKTTDKFVLFYGQSEVFSNWHKAGFTVKGIAFANGEQYMMYCKAMFFKDEATAKLILAEPDPKKVKVLGRQVKHYVEADWAANRLRFVRRGLLEKARQNPEVKATLLATGDRILVEAAPPDRIWGIGLGENDPRALDPTKWLGLNLLGEAWMWVRDVLRREKAREDGLCGWTNQQAKDFLASIATDLTAMSVKAVVIGSVARVGESSNDLDILLVPEQAMTLETIIGAVEEQLVPKISPNQRADVCESSYEGLDQFFLNIELHDGKIVEFYLPEHAFPMEHKY